MEHKRRDQCIAENGNCSQRCNYRRRSKPVYPSSVKALMRIEACNHDIASKEIVPQPITSGRAEVGKIHATKLPVSPMTMRTSPVHQSLLFKYRPSLSFSSSSSSSFGCGVPYVVDELPVSVLLRGPCRRRCIRSWARRWMLRAKEMMTLPDRQMMTPISVAHEDSLGGNVSAILVVRRACGVMWWKPPKFAADPLLSPDRLIMINQLPRNLTKLDFLI